MKNIFIGNLDFDTSEENLRQIFAAYGAVTSEHHQGSVHREIARLCFRGDG